MVQLQQIGDPDLPSTNPTLVIQVTNAIQLITFIIFLIGTRRLLQRNNQSLDDYMKWTLILLFTSLLLSNCEFLSYLMNDEPLKSIFNTWLPGYPQQLLEKIAIFIDIARLLVIIVGLKYAENIRLSKVRRIHILLFTQIALVSILVTVLFYEDVVLFYDKSKMNQDEVDSRYLVLKITRSIFTVQSNLGIIVAYLVIYFKLRTHYLTQSLYNGHNKIRMQRVMINNLRSLLVLFISICQIYIYRIFRDLMVIFDNYGATEKQEVFYICKTVQVLGICISLYWRMHISISFKQEAQVNVNTQSQGTASNLGS